MKGKTDADGKSTDAQAVPLGQAVSEQAVSEERKEQDGGKKAAEGSGTRSPEILASLNSESGHPPAPANRSSSEPGHPPAPSNRSSSASSESAPPGNASCRADALG